MDVVTMLPDESALRRDIVGARFLLGLHQERWRLGNINWPFVHIAVRASERKNAPNEFWFRFDCAGYPQQAPTARPWDETTNQPLAASYWPTGRSRIPAVFRTDWKGGTCLYLPCDRIAAAGHDAWRVNYPSLQWCPVRGLMIYLEELFALLNSSDYTGVRCG